MPARKGGGSLSRKAGEAEINTFLTYLAVEKRISASTQTQALCALLYLYREVLGRDVGELEGLVRAKRRRRLPVVLTRDEVHRVLGALEGRERLVLTLLYGSGLRLMEGLRLRVKDIDFSYGQVTVREGKGGKDRTTMLPASIQEDLRKHLRACRARLTPWADKPLPQIRPESLPREIGQVSFFSMESRETTGQAGILSPCAHDG